MSKQLSLPTGLVQQALVALPTDGRERRCKVEGQTFRPRGHAAAPRVIKFSIRNMFREDSL